MSTVSSRGLITDDALAQLRARIGQELQTREEPHLEEATADAIRHWVRATGDLDPKWTDPDHAARTRFGRITAPPSFLYAFHIITIGDRSGLPGVHAFFSGADHEWYLPIFRNDRITVKVVLKDVVEKQSRFANRMIQQISEVTFVNQDGQVVARSRPWGMRTERRAAAEKGKYRPLELAQYTEADIRQIAERYEREPELIRGATPRYWQDVHVMEEIPQIIRGPWTSSISVNFVHAHGGMFLKSHAYWFRYLKWHPEAGIPNEQGIPEGPVRGHWDSDFARRIGVPAAYDYGPERIAWLCTLLTYWCGDEGWLKRLYVEVRRFNLVGDLTTLGGTVTAKRVDGGEHLVDCDVWARDQRGTNTLVGKATVRLPARRS